MDKEFDSVIKELNKEHPIEEMVKFNDANISDKIKDNTWLEVKYHDLYLKEKNELDSLLALKDKIVGERYDYYIKGKLEDQKTLREMTPKEIEKYYLPSDDKVIRINRLVQKQQWRVDFFDMCRKAFNQQGWRMKNFLDADKR